MRFIKFLIALLLSALMIGSGCKSNKLLRMRSVSMQVLKPAPVSVPTHIKKLAVINRAVASEKNKNLNVVEGILTGEGIYADKEGSDECLIGLREILMRTDRFTVAIVTGNEYSQGTGTEVFAQPLTWAQVEKICTDNAADGVVSLESFDSDAIINMSVGQIRSTDVRGNPIMVNEHRAAMQMDVKTGWRIYDPKTKTIVDEHKSLNDMRFNNNAPTPELARLGISKRDAVKQTGRSSGKQYGNRISPSWVGVSRSYYSNYNERFQLAAKKVQYDDWEGASEIWKEFMNGSDRTAGGLACYNMAVFAEVKGNLDAAIEWTNKAYKEYENFNALNYKKVLEQRVYDVQQLDNQLGK